MEWMVHKKSTVAHWFETSVFGHRMSVCGLVYQDYELLEEKYAETMCKRCLVWKKKKKEKVWREISSRMGGRAQRAEDD